MAEFIETEELRPSHYVAGSDTFAWAEENYPVEICLAMARFNIHKYFNRNKGQDTDDFKKIAVYALWAKKLEESK